MEIPQSSSHVSARDIDYLFEFSPETSGHQLDDTCLVVPVTGAIVAGAGAAGGETQSVAVHRGVSNTALTLKDLDTSSSTKKKQKFFTEMKTTHKLEKSRQSARECRARKKLRYQYLDDLILERERANERLRGEMSKFVEWCNIIDQNNVPDGMQEFLNSNLEEQQ